MPTGTQRFPKQCRLSNAAEFERVLRAPGFRKNRGPLRILAVANTMPFARLGLVIGRRAVRRANRRNAAKRVVREVFRKVRVGLPAVDVVVHLRGPVESVRLRSWLEEELGAMARSESTNREEDSRWAVARQPR